MSIQGLRCTPCGGEIVDGQKIISIVRNLEGQLIVTVHCQHSEPPPENAVIIASDDCLIQWFADWAATLHCRHKN